MHSGRATLAVKEYLCDEFGGQTSAKAMRKIVSLGSSTAPASEYARETSFSRAPGSLLSSCSVAPVISLATDAMAFCCVAMFVMSPIEKEFR